MYKLVFFVPESHLEVVKRAAFDAGAGAIGDYEHCCWQVKGTGQFRALANANPFIGAVGELEQVDEFRVEMICATTAIKVVVAAFKGAHPYEEPAYDIVELVDL